MAYGLFTYQGWNPCPLHWQEDSWPLSLQGSPHDLSEKTVVTGSLPCLTPSYGFPFKSSMVWVPALLAPITLFIKNKTRSVRPFNFVCACSVRSNSLWPHELQPTRLLHPWDFPGKNTEVGCHFLLQGIFLTQGLNLCLLHWQSNSWPLCHLGSQGHHHLSIMSFNKIYISENLLSIILSSWNFKMTNAHIF